MDNGIFNLIKKSSQYEEGIRESEDRLQKLTRTKMRRQHLGNAK
jgi:hypothetical protein